jgi:hypothetical protein
MTNPAAMPTIAAFDLETTGLYVNRGHEPWDIAVIIRRPGYGDQEHQWFVRPDLTKADPMSLRVGRYYERTASLQAAGARKAGPKWSDAPKVAAELAELLDGVTILGAVPGFDQRMIERFLLQHGQCLTAHYQPCDVETLVAGYLTGLADAGAIPDRPKLPLNSESLSLAVGVDPASYDLHTALGDCRWALAQYDAVTRTKEHM